MSFIDHVRIPDALSWLRNRAGNADPSMSVSQTGPSIASVEYELRQLRVSLRGIVDFGDAQREDLAGARAVAAVSSAGGIVAPGSGLKRRHDLHLKFADQSN